MPKKKQTPATVFVKREEEVEEEEELFIILDDDVILDDDESETTSPPSSSSKTGMEMVVYGAKGSQKSSILVDKKNKNKNVRFKPYSTPPPPPPPKKLAKGGENGVHAYGVAKRKRIDEEEDIFVLEDEDEEEEGEEQKASDQEEEEGEGDRIIDMSYEEGDDDEDEEEEGDEDEDEDDIVEINDEEEVQKEEKKPKERRSLDESVSHEKIKRMLEGTNVIFSMGEHMKMLKEVASALPTFDARRQTYEQFMEKVLSSLRDTVLKNQQKNQNNKKDVVQIIWTEPRDPLYFMDKLASDPGTTTCMSDVSNIEEMKLKIPLETRSWIESYQRERDPSKEELDCINGAQCEGTKIRNVPEEKRFILTRFYTKLEVEQASKGIKYLDPNRACVFCIMSDQIRNFISYPVTGRTAKPNAVNQDFRVAEGMVGQWPISCCIWSAYCGEGKEPYYGLMGSIPIYSRGGYTYQEINGLKHYVSKAPVPTKKEEEALVQTAGFRMAPSTVNPTRN